MAAAGERRWDEGPVRIDLPARIFRFLDEGDEIDDTEQWRILEGLPTNIGAWRENCAGRPTWASRTGMPSKRHSPPPRSRPWSLRGRSTGSRWPRSRSWREDRGRRDRRADLGRDSVLLKG
jgi:hypothetical protein